MSIVEKMALAIEREICRRATEDATTEDGPEEIRSDVRAALSALGIPVETLEKIASGEWVAVPKEPDTAMLRALLRHRGYDPDANEDTLDTLGQLDIATMGTFIAAYRAMLSASESEG